MSNRSLNGLSSDITNVYINTNLTATLPLEENQSNFNNPIVISLKGLNGFTGGGQIIKINSANNALEYATETDTVYTAITPLVINPLNNEISLSGLVGYGTAGYVLKTNGVSNTVGWAEETDTVYSFTSPLLNNGSNTISLGGLTAFGSGDANKAIIVNGSGTALEYAVQEDTTYTFQSPLVNFFGGNTITLDTVPTGKGGTNLINYTLGDMLYCSATNVLSKLAIGTTDQVLTVNTGVPSWQDTQAPDLTLSTNFGTAVPGGNTIKLGNSSGNSNTTPLELYSNATLKIFNTSNNGSNPPQAQFTFSGSGTNLSLQGGSLITSVIGTGSEFLSNIPIGVLYGGTGKSSLTGQATKILQVNAGATGYDFVPIPIGNTYTGTGLIAVNSSTNVISFTGSIPTDNNQLLNGAGYITSSSIPTAQWTTNGNTLHPAIPMLDRLVIGGTSSFTTGQFFTCYGSMYCNDKIDFNKATGNEIFLACNATYSNDIYFGSQTSQNSSNNDGALLRNVNTSSLVNTFYINSLSSGTNTTRFSVYSNSGDTEVSVESYFGSAELNIGEFNSYYKFEVVQGGSTFKLKNYDGTTIFGYTRSNDYFDWGSVSTGTRMNFGNYTLHGTSNTTYPTNTSFSTIDKAYIKTGYIYQLTTDDIGLFHSGGTGTSNNIRCNSSGQIYFTNPVYGGPLQIIGGITGDLPITGTLSSSSNRFKAQYSSSRLYILNPSGTNSAIGFNGSYIHWHDNSTELNFNTPNQSYKNTNSQSTSFFSGGSKRMKLNGSTTPSLELYQTNGSTKHSQFGYGTTFPSSGMGEWSGFNVPIGNSIYYGGSVSEGCLLAMNGDTAMISNPGDNQSFWYYDEDGRGAKWYITVAGVISPASDIRIKTDIKTYKNSDFEKFKKLRTITYKFKKPKNISPERLLKQGCINKYADHHYGVIAQELFELYPELEECDDIRKRENYYYRKDNWDNGVYEKEHKKWVEDKETFMCESKEEGKDCCYKETEPPKIFDEEEPMRAVGYSKLPLMTIGVVQDLIVENETLKSELNAIKEMLNKLVNAKSFADFKKTIA